MLRPLACLEILTGLLAAADTASLPAQTPVQASAPGIVPRFGDGRDWFFTHRFGLFVHWGFSAIPGWHEQH